MQKKSNKNIKSREHFSSRLGFILISAGCAIGLGNVWKFPYVVGKYGGAAFLLLYIICVIILAIPLMTFEFAVGRASQHSNALSIDTLEPKGSKWHYFKWVSLFGQYLLMFFYTTVCGWMLCYILKEAFGTFKEPNADFTAQVFHDMTSNPYEIICWMIIACIIGMLVCRAGVQKGIEKITKILMAILFAVMIFLAIFSLLQPGAEEGLNFYLMPDLSTIFASWPHFLDALYEAMSLAFFTMSVGMGSMVVFGSYIGKERSLFGEALTVSALNIVVAIIAGLIIFPACFAYDINPGSGPSLVFQTLPNVFASMPYGSFFGTLFFIFLSFASLSTVIAVFENFISFWIELKGWSRKKSVRLNFVIIVIGSLPCCLGFNVFNFIPLPFDWMTSFMDLEDFIISNNVLPLGAIFFALFCSLKQGWGWRKSIKEINTGKGIKFPFWGQLWTTIIIPFCIIGIFITGWVIALR